jgi:hypothetical protein
MFSLMPGMPPQAAAPGVTIEQKWINWSNLAQLTFFYWKYPAIAVK